MDFAFLEVGLSALAADPGGHGVQGQMVAFAIDVEGCGCPLHRRFAMHALHLPVLPAFFLTLNDESHSLGSGVYAVMIARNSGFGEQTTAMAANDFRVALNGLAAQYAAANIPGLLEFYRAVTSADGVDLPRHPDVASAAPGL